MIAPLALAKSVLNEGEREFGATVIDMGGGQTTVASMRNQELQYTNIYSEGSDYVTKDISKVLRTTVEIAEALKFNFGQANVEEASTSDTVQVNVVGNEEPVEITESYLSQIISGRIRQILEHVKQDLGRGRLLDLPGGIILVGGGAIMPGVVEVAQQIFGTRVKLHVPNQVGIRNPMFANVISIVDYVGMMSEVDIIAQHAVTGDEMLRHKPVDFDYKEKTNTMSTMPYSEPLTSSMEDSNLEPIRARENAQEPTEPKANIGERIRGIFGSMFD